MKKFLIEGANARLAAMPMAYGNNFVQFEGTLYNLAALQLGGYEGGYWDFWKLENGALFLCLSSDTMKSEHPDGLFDYRVNTNGYEGRMSLEAASLALNIAAANLMLWFEFEKLNGDRESPAYRLANLQYTRLQEFGFKHPEAAAIFAALD
jgi:hypothetical protein